MILIITLSILVFAGFCLNYKLKNRHVTIQDTINETWKTYVLNNQYYYYWGAGIIILLVFSLLVPNQFDNLGSGLGNFFMVILSVAGSAAGLWGFIWLIKKLFTIRNESYERDTSYGSAIMTPVSVLANAGLLTIPQKSSNYLYIGGLNFNDRQGHLLTVAGSRSGKGVSLIIPNLLLPNMDSFVITDPKGENAYMSARFQNEALKKKVIILDPWGEQKRLGAKHGVAISGFNPLDFIKSNPDELSDSCGLIAEMIVPNNPNAKEPFWENSARSIIKTYLLHMLTKYPEKEHNLWTLYKWLRYDSDERITLWAEMKLSTALDGLVSIAAGEFLHFSDSSNTLSSVISTAHDATRFIESKQLRESLCKSDFNPYDLTNGKMAVYINLPERFFNTHNRWLRLVVGLCLRACNHKPKERVNFILDECGVLGKLDDIRSGYAFAAGQNIRLWSFFQNLGQIKEIYGEDGLPSFTGCQCFQVFGIDDYETAEKISKMLGETTITVQNKSFSSGKEGGTTTSYNKAGRPLMTPDEVQKTHDVINFFRDGKDKYKFRSIRWGYFEESPFKGTKDYNPENDNFAKMGALFKSRVDTLPQFENEQLMIME